MRLICPNCQAQYEVPVEVIPDAGRDVQCSSCGTTWFQAHPHAAAADEDPHHVPDRTTEASEEAPKPADEPPLAEPVPDADTTPRATRTDPAIPAERPSDTGTHPEQPAPRPEIYSDESPSETTAAAPDRTDAEAGHPPEAPDEDTPPPAAPPEPARSRRLDPGVAEVLRTEAEREARQRAADGAAAEKAPEPKPQDTSETETETDPRATQARERMAKLLGEPKDDARRAQLAASERARAAASSTGDVGGRGRYDRDDDMLADQGPTPAETASRRGLLPDVNEINQSLRPGDKRRAVDTTRTRGRDTDEGSGFGRGFIIVLALGIVLIALYLAAPAIAETIPALADPLAAYVDAVNAARSWLDARATAFLAWLNGLTSGS